MFPASARFDIACRVVDNYGDAGVALRLARQLSLEHGAEVTLWIDALDALARIAPGVAPEVREQRHGGIVVRVLDDGADFDRLPAVIVEAFGCGLPERWLERMESAARPPVWINLEYLSAEAWVDGVHGLPSPQPARALTRWFFCPGFTAATGGLLRERDLVARRDAFHRDAAAARAHPWLSLGLPEPAPDALTVSLFCYPGEALAGLAEAWTQDRSPVACLVPEGVAAQSLARLFGGTLPPTGGIGRRGALALAVVPFVDQHAYDRRLWSCDLNVVRGEDSFVRAQWAARPMAWHAYPQADDAHRAKLEAFLDRYCGQLEVAAAAAMRGLARALNGSSTDPVGKSWQAFREALPALDAHAVRWAGLLARQSDLAGQLVEFCRARL